MTITLLVVGVNFPDGFLLPDVPEDDDDVEDDDDEDDEEEDENAPCSSNRSWPAPILLVPPTPGIVLPTDADVGDCVGEVSLLVMFQKEEIVMV